MAIVEVFLGAILTVLLEKLASGELLKFLRRVGIDAQLKEWHTTLLMIEAVLTDAENKQTANRAVKLWLNDLEDLAYDLEDLVDELNTEASLRKIRENKGSTSKVKKLIPTCCTNLSPRDFMFERGTASKLKEISSRLEALSKQIKMLNLVETVRGRPYERLPTTSLVVESEVRGREEDKEKIIEILFGVESNDNPISVIPIVGMGGVGKTTLVQLVYNDERLMDKFDLKAWACVSDEFDAIKVTKNILEAVSSGGRCDSENFDMLQVKLKESLSNKKFLVVLDDIWHENDGDWEILLRPFLAGKPGSKIIITTRLEGVAKIMSKIPAYHLNLLSEGDALSLLAQRALGSKTFDAYPGLIEIGKSMVRRCKCLPLAVKALGGLLRTAVGPEEWEKVLKSEIWMAEEKSKIIPALKLSYQYLSPQLKRCFAYCALFPKDYEFIKFDLVHLWMAEGLVQESKKDMLKVCVKSCPQLLSLQEIDVLPDLRRLTINDCGALELLPNKMSCLEWLYIDKCPSLKTMMKLKDCSTSLNTLLIGSWVNLNLTNLLGSGHNYPSLTSIGIWSCDGLESFLHGGLPTPNLKYLWIRDCQHLESLPERMDLLSSLSNLTVYSCPSLMELFLPPNLSHLSIYDCGKLKPLGEWGLHKLTSLEYFKFDGCPELVSFTNNADEEHCVLPPSLISLTLKDMPNLETLSKDVQNLTSLQHLSINECPKLEALPTEDQLEKLSSLRIGNCPLIKKQCLKSKGDYWPVIAVIPLVEIDDRSIYNPCP